MIVVKAAKNRHSATKPEPAEQAVEPMQEEEIET